MSTLVRIVVTSIISLLMLSCNFSMNFGEGIDGDRNVVTSEREVEGNFNAVKVSQGLELYITQSDDVEITVEADENLQELIVTEVDNGELKIFSTKNIRRAASRKIYVSFPDINRIKASSGSSVYSNNTINSEDLELKSSSGANIKIDVETNTLICDSSSGGYIQLDGNTVSLMTEASSGSNISASSLKAESTTAKASSGARIQINTSKALTARASSGGDIRYSGNPERVEKSDSSSGSVRAN